MADLKYRNGAESRARDKIATLEILSQVSERVTSTEANWLISRINRDGKLSDAERAVLTFIKHESPEIDPVLKPLLDLFA